MRKLIGLALVLALVSACDDPATPAGGSIVPMSTLTLVPDLVSGVTTSAGVAVASGKAHFYALSTTTPVTVYSDATGSTPITQPLTLTAAGTGTVYTVGAARMVVKDALDTSTVLDVNVNTPREDGIYVTSPSFNGGSETTLSTILDGWSTAFGGAAGYFQYKYSSAATERNPGDWMHDAFVSVKDFGALGDNSHNDTTAIQAAINAAQSTGAGIVFFPQGTYLITSALTVTTTGLELIGAGDTATIIMTTDSTIDAFQFNVPSSAPLSCRISKIGITSSGSSTGSAINVAGSTGIFIEDISTPTERFRFGVTVNASSGLTVIHGSGIVVRSADASSAAVNITSSGGTVYISDSRLASYGAHAINVSSGATVLFTNVTTVGAASAANGLTVSGAGSVYGSASVMNGGASGHGISLGSSTADARFSAVQTSPDSLDARAGSPVFFALSANGSVTPLPGRTNKTTITGTTNGITVTVADPGTAIDGTEHTIMFVNATGGGGSVTWSINANLHKSGAVAPTDGNRISVTWKYDAQAAHWYEVSRSASVPN